MGRPTPRRRTFAVLLVVLGLASVSPAAALAESPSPETPTAADDSYGTDEDTPLIVAPENGLLANDHPGPQTCLAAVDQSSLAGTAEVQADGSFTFTPTTNANGATTFTYGIATDTGSGCPEAAETTATVTITVNPVNDPPTAVGDSFTALRDRTLNVAAPGVLGNDSDVDGDPLTAIKTAGPAHGVVTLAQDGSFSYTPTTGYVGPDAFSYRASDGTATSPQRVVSLTVVTVPPSPSPTPAPTPTPALTPSPAPSPTESPLPSDSGPASPSASAAASGLPSGSPEPSAGAGPVSNTGGPPIIAIGALVLLAGLLAVAAVYFVRSQGAGGDDALEPDHVDGGFDNEGDDAG